MCLHWILFIYDYWQPAKLIKNSYFLPFALALTWPIFMRIIVDTVAVVVYGHSLIDHILIVYTHLMMVYLSIVCVCVCAAAAPPLLIHYKLHNIYNSFAS